MHEECPELTENIILQKATAIHLEYSCKIAELVKDLSYTKCREIYSLCDLAKTNNCTVSMYSCTKDLKNCLNDTMQWHKFYRVVHGIDFQ
jgi:hypothetical protein